MGGRPGVMNWMGFGGIASFGCNSGCPFVDGVVVGWKQRIDCDCYFIRQITASSGGSVFSCRYSIVIIHCFFQEVLLASDRATMLNRDFVGEFGFCVKCGWHAAAKPRFI